MNEITTPSISSENQIPQLKFVDLSLESLNSDKSVAIITLGKSSEYTVTLSEQRIKELEEVLKFCLTNKSIISGLIITGPRLEMFTVGADLSAIKSITEEQEGIRLAELGQSVFNLLAELPFKTVAAISGPCVGGGYELALACSIRICSDHKSTLIGLPEVKLGIIPGFGGCVRLPKLIGLPKALDIILAGKTLNAKQALTDGLVDEVVSSHHLIQRAKSIIAGTATLKPRTIPLKEKLLTFSSIGRAVVKKITTTKLKSKHLDNYPAPFLALQTTIFGLEHGINQGLKAERDAIGKLVTSPICKSLVRLFFLTEEAKSLGKSGEAELKDLSAIVVGAGVMGKGIAETFARKGFQVILKDQNTNALNNAKQSITDSLRSSKNYSTSEQDNILDLISYSNDDCYKISPLNFVVEAIIEDLDLKAKVLEGIANKLPSDSIIATNTSSLSISTLASKIPNPERFIGMHFFNPVNKMPLVEVIRGKLSSPKSIVITAALAKRLGKIPVIVEDVPGFLVNRILTSYLLSASNLLDQGFRIEDIDSAAVNFGMPMGPLRLLDEIGHDVAAYVGDIIEQGYGERMKSSDYSKKLKNQGLLGKKSGRGFYTFSNQNVRINPDIATLLSLKNSKSTLNKEQLGEALILPMAMEAIRALDEGVAGQPDDESSKGQIDLASVMGLGFPAFRGGIVNYISSFEFTELTKKLNYYHEELGSVLYEIPSFLEKRLTK